MLGQFFLVIANVISITLIAFKNVNNALICYQRRGLFSCSLSLSPKIAGLKIGDKVRVQESKPSLVTNQCVVYRFFFQSLSTLTIHSNIVSVQYVKNMLAFGAKTRPFGGLLFKDIF